MKKALVLIMILLVAICVVACGSETPAETTENTTAGITTTGTTEGTTPETTKTDFTSAILYDTVPVVVTTAPTGEKLETEDYTAVLNGDEWTKSEVDTSKFDIFGTGVSAISQISTGYNGYTKNYTDRKSVV